MQHHGTPHTGGRPVVRSSPRAFSQAQGTTVSATNSKYGIPDGSRALKRFFDIPFHQHGTSSITMCRKREV